MGGGEPGAREHRAWWADLVAGVAHAERIPRPAAGFTEEAPVATLIARLGLSSPAPRSRDGTNPTPRSPLFAILLAALLVEWTSRRLRGAP